MPVQKVSIICPDCGQELTKGKYAALRNPRCRKCSIRKTYKDSPEKLKLAVEKRIQTCEAEYGVPNVAQNEEIKQKWVQTKIERTGFAGYFQQPGVQDRVQPLAHNEQAYRKREKTCLALRGKKHHMKTPEMKDKISNTYKDRTGYANPMHNPEVLAGIRDLYGQIGSTSGYIYNDMKFDSSWEIAYYIWLTDHGKKFIYHPPISFPFIGTDGREHVYWPDFLVEGIFYEIKGSQFFNEKGEPYNMYYKDFWWEKFKMMESMGVVILREDAMRVYLKYVKDKYGSQFLKKLKVKKIKKGSK